MNDIKNLWPLDLGSINIVMPKEILSKQAAFLSELTSNVLTAEVETTQGIRGNAKEKVMIHSFTIKSPAMGNYQFTLLRVIHDFGIYPLRVYDDLIDEYYEPENEEEFMGALSGIFSNQKTQNAIKALVAQSV